jgi:hypothetical protein
VLHDLGLAGVLPAGWVTVDGTTIEFGALDVPTADHLICHLEDLADQVAPAMAASAAARRTAGAGQAALFGDER